MKIYPSPKLGDLYYVPGLGEDGAEFPDDEAQALLDAGLAVKTKPKPAAPAEKSEEPE